MTTRRLVSLALLLLTVTATATPVPARDYSRQVVEISVTYQRHNPRQPWSKNRPYTRSAMAIVVDGSRLLTTAQMVSNATLVRAQKFGSPPKVAARITHVDNEANLALLSVDDPTFFEGLEPVSLRKELPIEGTVNSVRWKSGQFEVSESRIVRIEVLRSPVGALRYACLRVKSDLGGGGWAEPVFLEDHLVGLTFTAGDDLSNVLPADLIGEYLKSAGRQEKYRGFGSLGISWKQNRDRAQQNKKETTQDRIGPLERMARLDVKGDQIAVISLDNNVDRASVDDRIVRQDQIPQRPNCGLPYSRDSVGIGSHSGRDGRRERRTRSEVDTVVLRHGFGISRDKTGIWAIERLEKENAAGC